MTRTTAGVGGAAFREPLTRDRVLTSAIALADRAGVGGLSMRKLAGEVGFEVMSLYHHVANKDDLLDAMVDLVAAGVVTPPETAPWREALRATAVSIHHSLLSHPWSAPLWSSRPPGPARLALMETLLRTLARSGLPHDLAHHGFHAVNNHVLGYSLQEQSFEVRGAAEMAAMARDFLAGLPAETYPHLAAHVREHLEGPAPGRSFEFVLDLILDGLEARR